MKFEIYEEELYTTKNRDHGDWVGGTDAGGQPGGTDTGRAHSYGVGYRRRECQ